jgi:uncharacterized protein YlxP (DUF503 family)
MAKAVTIGVLRLTFALPAESLKEKRAIVRSVIERLRNRFNAAVAEVDDLDLPGRTVIAAVCLSNSSRHAQSQVQAMADAVTGWRLDLEILDVETELLLY